jgi:bacillithiol biosynthesis deacetylase BshB1
MESVMLDCLVIAPHPDDAELGLGGTIALMLARGMKVGVLDLTNGEPTPHGSVEIRARETAAATKVLGLEWRENLGLPNRSLEATLENRALLAGVFRRVRPRWLFAPYWVDAHPDHVAATQLIEAARFWSKLTKTDMPGEPFHPQRVFYFWCVHLRTLAEPAFVVDISPHWDVKRRAIECYQSQFVTGREKDSPPFIDRLRDQAAYWGWSIGTQYGEPIFSREPVGVRGFADFV